MSSTSSSGSSSDEQERGSSYSTDATSVVSADQVAQENNADGSNDGVDRQQLGHEGGCGEYGQHGIALTAML